MHSLKDLSAELPRGLSIAAYPEREDTRDALVSVHGGSLTDLPRGARVGTSSLRRRAALLAQRRDLDVVSLRGNVPTRVNKVGRDGLAGAGLALAGLKRARPAAGGAPPAPARVPPAPRQGGVARGGRGGGGRAGAVPGAPGTPARGRAVEAERAAMVVLEGGCQAAIGAWCGTHEGALTLHVAVFAADGSRVRWAVGAADTAAPAGGGPAGGRR